MTFVPEDPAGRLHAAFAAVAAGPMAGLPVCNPALAVEVVDLAPWQGDWLGVLVLPWAMNFVILPGCGDFRPLQVGQSQTWCFPSGEYVFLGQQLDGLGSYQSAALYSPMDAFASQRDAVAVARACLAALLAPAGAGPADAVAAEADRLAGRSRSARALSRRAFLHGGLFGGRQ